MKDKVIIQNREVIDSLIDEIQTLQKDVKLHDTEAREKYKLKIHIIPLKTSRRCK